MPPTKRTDSAVLLYTRWLPSVLLCLLAVVMMWPIVGGHIFLPLDIVPHQHPWRYSYERVPVNNPRNSDIIQQVYPRRLLADQMVRQGAWPLWNPTILTGTPLLADGQLLFFYPPTLLFVLLPLARAFGVYALLQLILAGLGSYLFARRLKLSRAASTVSGICFMFSGYMITWLQFPHHSGAVAMLPWCFWAVTRATNQDGPGGWLLAGLILAMPLLTHIQLAFYIYIGVGCYVLVLLAQAASWRLRLRLGVGFGLAVLVAGTLSAVQLVPQFALAAEGQRVEQVLQLGSGEQYFISLLQLVLPLIGGEARTAAPGWGPALLQSPGFYTGIAPLFCALVALLVSHHRMSSFFGVLAICSFALAIASPLVQLLIMLVPAYRQFTDHQRWLVLWGFAVAILAGMGVDGLRQDARPEHRSGHRVLFVNRALLGLTALFVLVWSFRHLALFTPASRYGQYITIIRQQPPGIPLLLGVVTLVVALALKRRYVPRLLRWSLLFGVVAGDLLWYGHGYNTSSHPNIYHPTRDLLAELPPDQRRQDPNQLYPPSRQVAFLQAQPRPFRFLGGDYPVFLPNLATVFGLEDVRGYQSLYLARYNRLARLIDGKDYSRLAGAGGTSLRPYFTEAYTHRRLLDMLNVKFILFPPNSKNPPLYAPLELVQRNDEGTIYQNPNVLPRAWLVHQVEVLPDDQAQLDRLARSDFDPRRVAVVPSSVPPLGLPSAGDHVDSLQYGPNLLSLQATTRSPALLVVSDAYTDDWRVEVDGRPAPLYRANYALRGVWLPEGSHDITFRYRPRSFLIGGAVTLGSLSGLAGYSIWTLLRRSRLRSRRSTGVIVPPTALY